MNLMEQYQKLEKEAVIKEVGNYGLRYLIPLVRKEDEHGKVYLCHEKQDILKGLQIYKWNTGRRWTWQVANIIKGPSGIYEMHEVGDNFTAPDLDWKVLKELYTLARKMIFDAKYKKKWRKEGASAPFFKFSKWM